MFLTHENDLIRQLTRKQQTVAPLEHVWASPIFMGVLILGNRDSAGERFSLPSTGEYYTPQERHKGLRHSKQEREHGDKPARKPAWCGPALQRPGLALGHSVAVLV